MSARLLVGFLAVYGSVRVCEAAPEIGSANTVTAEPPLIRASSQPCSVELFSGLVFADFSPKSFSYVPPAACPGPFAQVVLEVDLSVTPGRQFDRTVNVWIGGVNVYFGTTQEPSATVGPTWHVERDLSDYGSLFTLDRAGEVRLDNVVDATYTGILAGSARVLLYPVEPGHGARSAADLVVPLSATDTGGTQSLATSDDRLARVVELPPNVERAYLDVYAQSQASDEFWYSCLPDDLAATLGGCGGTALRETEIMIDGQAAGVAPVFPWLYTGAIDPVLWRPIPAVQALAFEPYRVDLTPFAGLLADGSPHEVALRVHNAQDHFSLTAILLVYLDHGVERVTGGVTENTLAAAPESSVTNDLATTSDGGILGRVAVSAARRFVIAGSVRTSHGLVETQVIQSTDFSNEQVFDVSSTRYDWDLEQTTRIDVVTRTTVDGRSDELRSQRTWPLSIHYSDRAEPGQNEVLEIGMRQADERLESTWHDGQLLRSTVLENVVEPSDRRELDATLGTLGAARTVQRYFFSDSAGTCYSRELRAAMAVLTDVIDGERCEPLDGTH